MAGQARHTLATGATYLGRKSACTDATVVIIKSAGHRILEEQPDETIAALVRFLQVDLSWLRRDHF